MDSHDPQSTPTTVLPQQDPWADYPWGAGTTGGPGRGRQRRSGRATRWMGAAAVLVLAGGVLGAHAVTSASTSPSPVMLRPQWWGGSQPTLPGGQSGRGSTPSITAATAAQQVGVVDVDTVIGYRGTRAAGTGMALTPGGEVLTNAHVVEGATRVEVTVPSTGRTYAASVVGADASQDVAVLQLLGASGLATVRTATGGVSVGDAVTGVGNAGGEGGAPSAAPGHVVAVDQTVTAADENGRGAQTLSGLIESDAAIEPGDSGGPLFDSSDQVVGMDTAGSASGTPDGFAIPIGTALSVAGQIVAGTDAAASQGSGQGTQPGSSAFLGVEVEDGPGGAVVAAVVPGSPAATSGLAEGDTITSLDGHAVRSTSDLRSVLGTVHPGQDVSLTWVDPAGQRQRSSVTLASAEG